MIIGRNFAELLSESWVCSFNEAADDHRRKLRCRAWRDCECCFNEAADDHRRKLDDSDLDPHRLEASMRPPMIIGGNRNPQVAAAITEGLQ